MGVLARAWISSLSDGKVKMEEIRKGVKLCTELFHQKIVLSKVIFSLNTPVDISKSISFQSDIEINNM